MFSNTKVIVTQRSRGAAIYRRREMCRTYGSDSRVFNAPNAAVDARRNRNRKQFAQFVTVLQKCHSTGVIMACRGSVRGWRQIDSVSRTWHLPGRPLFRSSNWLQSFSPTDR